MNKEIKTRWIAALQSGKYKQGHEQLRIKNINGEYYCCLGVLCDLYIKENSNISWGDKYIDIDSTKKIDNQQGYLPDEVCSWSGIPQTTEPNFTGESPEKEPMLYLAYLNDDRGYDFNQISSVIETLL